MRAAWIAENIGENFPPDYKVDEAFTIAESPTAHGVFTLSRPDDGWPLGDYRVEFCLDETLVEAIRVEISR